MKTIQGFIILNQSGNFGWDDNTEFYEDQSLAEDRAKSLQDEEITLKVVPATLSF